MHHTFPFCFWSFHSTKNQPFYFSEPGYEHITLCTNIRECLLYVCLLLHICRCQANLGSRHPALTRVDCLHRQYCQNLPLIPLIKVKCTLDHIVSSARVTKLIRYYKYHLYEEYTSNIIVWMPGLQVQLQRALIAFGAA